MLLILNANIHTMLTGVVFNGFISVSNGKILDIGTMRDIKNSSTAPDVQVMDATGYDVYPGFIDAHTHLGTFQNGEKYDYEDANEFSDLVTANLRIMDSINPMDTCFKEALSAGITSVVVSPGSGNPIAGDICAMKTYGHRVDDMIIKTPIGIKFAFGENPKTTYGENSRMVNTRMGVAGIIRDTLYKAKRYAEDKQKAMRDSECDFPDYDSKYEALIPLINGNILAHFHAHRADDIFTAIRIAKEFNLKYIIVHGTESHKIVKDLLSENVKVLVGPILSDRSKPELLNLSVNTAGILSNYSIEIAIITDHPETPIQFLPFCAQIAINNGMNKFEALKAITINPAKICGIDDRVGTLEKGKDADMVFFEQGSSCFGEAPKIVICDGKLVIDNR